MKIYTLLTFLLCFSIGITAVAQSRTVSGTITTAEGEPLPGVSVLLKNTNIGTVTGTEGTYTISVPESGGTLVFSFIGFSAQEVEVGSRSVLDITMEQDIQQLSEVVVTALGITREERSLGYATQEVDGDNLTLTKEQNVIGSLAGKIAGVQVTGSSGASMGGTQKIKIRGVNSINGGGQPLIVVDGTPISNSNFAGTNGGDYGNLGQDVNSEDIKSVNVLKGPAASALYGIRGQYGVIMITTKKGERGSNKVNVEVSSAFSMEKVGNLMPMQNLYGGGGSQTWRTFTVDGVEQKYVDVLYDESWGPKMDGTMVRDITSFYPQDPNYGKLTPFVPHPDNIKNFFETGTNLNNGIAVYGGTETSAYRISVNDTRIQGVEPNTWLKRNNLGINTSFDIAENLKLSSNINYATNSAQRPSQGYDGGSRGMFQWFQRNVDIERMKDYKYDDGTFLHWNIRRPNSSGEVTNFNALYWNNPYFEAYENLNNDSRERYFGDIGLTYEISPGLSIKGFIRSDMYTQNIQTREAIGSRYTPGFYIGKFQNREMNYELLATYNKNFGDISFSGNLGTNLYNRNYSYLTQSTNGGLSTPGFYSIEASIDRPDVSNYSLRKQIRSFYALASFGYRSTYYIDATIRNDVSSALPTDNNSYWYPSLSGSFVFSELINWKPLALGKLRLSYAQAGSDLSPYQIEQTNGIGGLYGNIITLFERDVLANPNIKPSFANSYEVGTDLRFFNGRIGLDVTYYVQRNKDQIINLDISGASGYSATTINAGIIENKGIEIALSGQPVNTPNFVWNSNFNISKNNSMVVELFPGDPEGVYALDNNRYSSVSMYLNSYVGQPFGSLIGKAYQRDEATGKILLTESYDEDGNPTINHGMPLYTEAEHNFGSVLPDFTGGFQNTFRIFNNIEVGAMIDFQIGGQFISWSKMLSVKTGLAVETAAINENGKNVRDPLEEGGGVKVEGVLSESGEEWSGFVDARHYFRNYLGTHLYEEWLIDASYIKLRELSVGYVFSDKVLANTPFSQASISFIARNPAQIWQKAPEGLDPAELSTGASSISWLETGGLNTVRSYGINLNVTF